MNLELSRFHTRLMSGDKVLAACIALPGNPDAGAFRTIVRRFADKVDALRIGDGKEIEAVSPLAASVIALGEGVEPVLTLSTRGRDKNALISDFLGARALGILNVLCAAGDCRIPANFDTAQTDLDIDDAVLLQWLSNVERRTALAAAGTGVGLFPPCFLGASVAAIADPVEFLFPKLAQKIFVGAQFIIAGPVGNSDAFTRWWQEVTIRGLHEKTAIIAHVNITTPWKSEGIGTSPTTKSVATALNTVEKLASVHGLRGFEISCADPFATLDVLDRIRARMG
jgi:5,10-methylenetetrahydrofolate reductase